MTLAERLAAQQEALEQLNEWMADGTRLEEERESHRSRLRDVVNMARAAGLPVNAIARELGISRQALAERLRR